MTLLFRVTILLALLSNALAAENGPPRDLNPILSKLVEKYELPGVVGAILHGDQIVALGSAGVRKVGSTGAFLPTDLIHLGSDTKAMTALLIGQLIDKKQLAFDTTMREIFPDLAGKMDPAAAKITVRQLLDHNAGFPHDLDWWSFNATKKPLPEQRLMALEKALSAPPANPIGAYFYSNVSFVVLGAIVEAKTGRAWEDVIETELFRPLKMDSAGFGAPGTAGKKDAPDQPDQPWGHVLEHGKIKALHSDNAPVMGPAGTVHCSIEDWAKFITETMRGVQGHPTRVSAETYKALITPGTKQEYAGGWFIAPRPWAGGMTLDHAGSNTMWYCIVWIAPKKDFAILLATNYGSDPVGKELDEGVGTLIDYNEHLPGR